MKRYVSLTVLAVGFLSQACDSTVEPVDDASFVAVTPVLDASQRSGAVTAGVIFRRGPSESKSLQPADEELLTSSGAEIEYRFKGFRGVLVRVPAQALAGLRESSRVAHVGVPDNNLIPDSDTKGWERLAAPYGNNLDAGSVPTWGGARTVVAGTGIDCDNPDLNCAGGMSFASDGAPWNEDGFVPNGHETGVASIIMALTNGLGRYGWANDASLWSGRIFSNQITSDCARSAAMIDWAAHTIGAPIVNMSYSYPWSPGNEASCQIEKMAADSALWLRGTLLVASSGNIETYRQVGAPYPDSVGLPAAWPSVMAVGGMMCGSWSGTGCTYSARWWNGAAYGSKLDLVAAAHRVPRLRAGSTGLVVESGTSFAAPIVSAVAGLIASKFDCPTPGILVPYHLKNTAYGPSDIHLGAGKLDAGAALASFPYTCIEL